MPTDDELAQTATAPPEAPLAESATVPAGRGSAHAPAKAKLGRFELEDVLGAGGMGVVHAAFDPELERRVALKVLHGGSSDGRTRLLREARAMAKLSHANVITVFDVGTADGEDFVAMELIEGGTLGDWIKQTQPRPRDIIAAFSAAGRGLAAAHAEGLVHRDFKPSNVLRSKSGRIVVTDFGLARAEGADGRPSRPSLGVEQQLATAPALTKTGSLLGTPAYMAPEQWRSEPVTPATDQFAFCVALWEALGGKRPFAGDTLEDLRTDVLGGPADLDDAALPRKLRPILRRGLALDPAQRWPSIGELLVAIERATSRRSIAVLAGSGLIVASVGVYLAATSRTTTPSCVPPAIDPDSITLVPAAQPYVEHWQLARDAACEAPREVRTSRLSCLDAVFARIADAFHAQTPGPDWLGAELVDPQLCNTDAPPHLVMSIDARLSKAFALLGQARDSGRSTTTDLVAKGQPACARTVALLARRVDIDAIVDASVFGKLVQLFADIDEAAAGCDDDAIKVQAAFGSYTGEPNSLRRVELGAKQFPSDANLAALDEIHGDAAREDGKIDESLVTYDRALARHVAAHRTRAELAVAIQLMEIRIDRSSPEDLDAVVALDDRYAAVARTLGKTGVLSMFGATARWRLGQLEAAAREAASAIDDNPVSNALDAKWGPQHVKGTVVDEQGKPVAGVRVIAAPRLFGDDVAAASRLFSCGTVRETTTAADGTFELADGRGIAIAIAGDRASVPIAVAPWIALRLLPTSTVEGDVALGGEPYSRVQVAVVVAGPTRSQIHIAPVDRTGHFKLSRVPRGTWELGTMGLDHELQAPIKLAVPAVANAHLVMAPHAPRGKPLAIIGRSEVIGAPESALVWVFGGVHPDFKGSVTEMLEKLGGELASVQLSVSDHPAAAFAGHLQPDDLVGELTSRPDIDLTLCGVALSKKALSSATTADKLINLLTDATVGCVVVPASTDLAVVPLPAIKRQP